MRRERRRLAALAMVALIAAGCSDASSENDSASNSGTVNGSGGNKNATNRAKALRFAECMRDNGVSEFPDPGASGGLTVDGAVNGSSLDPSTPAWKHAIGACKDLQPPGFTGHARSAQEQESALKFAQCMRDNGIKDFPDPAKDAPLVDTSRIPSAAGRGALSIPGFQAAMDKCSALYADELGLRGR